MKILYRNAIEADIDEIGRLCADAFEGPFSWWQGFERIRAEENSRVSIKNRYYNFVLKNVKHAMVVACDSETKAVIGFLEVGQLPPPINEVNDAGEVIQHSDVSYLGNVAVDRNYRRQSIATKLVKISFKLLEKWNENVLYAAVDCSNIAAQKCYESAGFEIVLDERDLINRRASVAPRVFMKKQLNSVKLDPTKLLETQVEEAPIRTEGPPLA